MRALSAAILRGRNEWTSRGDAASYRLTARAAELAVVAELLALPEVEQQSMIAWLLDEGAACLLDAFVGEEQ